MKLFYGKGLQSFYGEKLHIGLLKKLCFSSNRVAKDSLNLRATTLKMLVPPDLYLYERFVENRNHLFLFGFLCTPLE